MRLRTCSESDLEEIIAIVADCPPLTVHTPYTYWATLRFHGELCLLAIEDGEAVGFVSCIVAADPADVVFVWQLAVRPSHRAHGLAGTLLREVGNRARATGKRAMQFSIAPSNVASTRSFERFAKDEGSTMTQIGEIALGDEHEWLYEIAFQSR